MLKLRRLPGLIYENRFPCIVSAILCLVLFSILLHLKVICTNYTPWKHKRDLCHDYIARKVGGSLCHALCDTEDISSLTCQTHHTEKETIFIAEFHQIKLVFKKARIDRKALEETFGNTNLISEEYFKRLIRYSALSKFNFNLTNEQLDRLTRYRPDEISDENLQARAMELKNLWMLIQDREYLCSALYGNLNIFPQILGSCGPFYAVDYVEPVAIPQQYFSEIEPKRVWVRKLRIAIDLLDYLTKLSYVKPVEPFYLCQIKLKDFGYESDHGGQLLKLMDLDMIYPKSVVNSLISEKDPCYSDNDCDINDCRGRCNLEKNRCHPRVFNNNLQIVCENIFLGSKSSNNIITPGLLTSHRTPSSLSVLLRRCANPRMESGKPRSATGHKIHTTLTIMLHQMANELDED